MMGAYNFSRYEYLSGMVKGAGYTHIGDGIR
jgi:hypothetical protein